MGGGHVKAVVSLAAAALVLAACGGGESSTTAAAAPDTSQVTEVTQPSTEDVEDMAENLAEDLEATQEAVGGGSATLTVGDQTWTFDSVLCAFGEEQIGQEGAEFNLSAIKDGLQLYASIDSFGHSVSLNDIQNFEDPSVSLDTFAVGSDEFIELDGKNVAATATFTDDVGGGEVEGTLEATCP
jgi:hypothetical protein